MSAQNPPPLDDEYFDQFDNSEEAAERAKESADKIMSAEKEEVTEKSLDLAENVSTQQWLEHETSRNIDTIPFRGRDFEWKEPGVIHRTKMIELAKEFGPEGIQNPKDDSEIDDVLEETFDVENLQTVVDLYNHVLKTLTELCTDPQMGDTSFSPGEELPNGALKWGQFPEDSENGEDGLTDLFQKVVMNRFDDEEETITVDQEERIDDF